MHVNLVASFENIGVAYVMKRRPSLTNQEIANCIYNGRKRPDATYQEFADRLLSMANRLDGGSLLTANTAVALGTFLSSAGSQKHDLP